MRAVQLVFLYAALAVGAYLLGSLPTGYLVARARGVDIRSVGSGNIGATNVFRVLGKAAGIGVLAVDALKGFIASGVLAPMMAKQISPEFSNDINLPDYFALVAGGGAVLGHNYTCWLKFKGGKGIATSAGVLVALTPWAFLIILAIFLIAFVGTRYVSLGSVLAAFCLPFAAWLTGESKIKIAVTTAMSLLAIYKHKANIQRLLNGTEARLGSSKPNSAPAP
ncbi:MAG: glycerol-3-phosphate 1-O-acyltransferase PlsY [Verrucomicrobia bacterium]|nr:glycerol-3-phosphate 1-O-acyltransferase PlsY [Verrucomicrobiota bacterium]